MRIQTLSRNSGDHKAEGKTACKQRSMEVWNPCFEEGRVNVEGKGSASEHRDRLEKNDGDKCFWLARLIRQPRERGLPLCFGFSYIILVHPLTYKWVSGLPELVFPFYK